MMPADLLLFLAAFLFGMAVGIKWMLHRMERALREADEGR